MIEFIECNTRSNTDYSLLTRAIHVLQRILRVYEDGNDLGVKLEFGERIGMRISEIRTRSMTPSELVLTLETIRACVKPCAVYKAATTISSSTTSPTPTPSTTINTDASSSEGGNEGDEIASGQQLRLVRSCETQISNALHKCSGSG